MFNYRHNFAKVAMGAGSAAVLGVLTGGLMWVGLGIDRAGELGRKPASVDSANTSASLTVETISLQTRPAGSRAPEVARSKVCQTLTQYPRSSDSLSFKTHVVAAICQPFIKYQRSDLDRCGDQKSDPYLSKFTWPTRQEMSRRGKVNVYADSAYAAKLPELLSRAEDLRSRATELCCGPDDLKCRTGMAAVKFEVCKPSSDPNQPDPCVFGGTYRMPGSGYDMIFRAIARQRGEGVANELREIATRNLTGRSPASLNGSGPESGSITLSSYISVDSGSASMDPVILHELGHACSMVKMQAASVDGSNMTKALHAAQWLDSAKKRCDPNFKIPDAVDDFWDSVGEPRELSSCLKDLATLNQKKLIDKPCNGLCPGHYLEESVGIAFSLLLGDLDGSASAVFPNTCDHVRDGQHPMVSDVAECLMQNSPRFRSRMNQAYGCEIPASVIAGGRLNAGPIAGLSAATSREIHSREPATFHESSVGGTGRAHEPASFREPSVAAKVTKSSF